MNYPEWTGDEPCRQIDPELFFPSSFNALRTKDKQLLKDMCASCPSQEPCLMWAIRSESEGWWAGTTPTDRKYLRRELGVYLQTPTIPITDRRAA
jgi:WhiB family redox-sensing transcriptional regulator